MERALESGAITDPVVECFVLPEWLAHPAERRVRIPRRNSFDTAGNASEWNDRLEQDVNVIGHNNVGKQIVMAAGERGLNFLLEAFDQFATSGECLFGLNLRHNRSPGGDRLRWDPDGG